MVLLCWFYPASEARRNTASSANRCKKNMQKSAEIILYRSCGFKYSLVFTPIFCEESQTKLIIFSKLGWLKTARKSVLCLYFCLVTNLLITWKINGWNLQITHLERKMIFQTSMIMFHVNLQGCTWEWPGMFWNDQVRFHMWLSKTLLQRMPRLTSSLQHSLGRRRGSSELRIWAEKYAETKIRYYHCYRTSDLFVIMFYMFHFCWKC